MYRLVEDNKYKPYAWSQCIATKNIIPVSDTPIPVFNLDKFDMVKIESVYGPLSQCMPLSSDRHAFKSDTYVVTLIIPSKKNYKTIILHVYRLVKNADVPVQSIIDAVMASEANLETIIINTYDLDIHTTIHRLFNASYLLSVGVYKEIK